MQLRNRLPHKNKAMIKKTTTVRNIKRLISYNCFARCIDDIICVKLLVLHGVNTNELQLDEKNNTAYNAQH